jgi:hypothetical protein
MISSLFIQLTNGVKKEFLTFCLLVGRLYMHDENEILYKRKKYL